MLRGLTVILLVCLNTLVWGGLIVLGGLFKAIARGAIERRLILILAGFGDTWVSNNNRIFDALLPTVWDIDPIDVPDPEGHYLILSNHLSWIDIPVLFRIFHRRTAFLRFFLKRVLIWVPVAGQACAALEMPFMKRYSPEYLARHPGKRGEDLAATRKACQRFRNIPVAILIFLEGTRFTPRKNAAEGAPYRHLLRPRIGGVSYVLATMGDQLSDVFDVTVAYPGVKMSAWKFVTGRVPRIVAKVRRVSMPREFLEQGITEPGPAREAFKEEIFRLWEAKDRELDAVLKV